MEHPHNGNFSTSNAAKTDAPKPRLWPLDSLGTELLNDARELHEAHTTGQPRGPLTGLKKLDQEIGGALPKDALTMILGNTGAGKTAFAGQIVARCGCPAVYLTTEMTPVELLRRHVARESSTFLGRLKSGELSPSEVGRLVGSTAQKLAHLKILDGTTAYASPSYLTQVVIEAKGDAKHAVLVVDSLHTWARGGESRLGEYEVLNYHINSLVGLSKIARCSVVIICEQNRAAMKEGASGNPNAGAGTRFIEYSADLLLDLEAKKDTNGAGERDVTLTLGKNRNGAAGKKIELRFNGALQRFDEATK